MRKTLLAIMAIAGVCVFAYAASGGANVLPAPKPVPPGASPESGALLSTQAPPVLKGAEYFAQEAKDAKASINQPHQGPPVKEKDGKDGLSSSYLYWKCYGSSYLWQTDKTGQNPTQYRSASWQVTNYQSLAPLTPDGSTIIEMQGGQSNIRKFDAVSGSYTDMNTGYSPCCGAVGCDNTYVYHFYCNTIYKFKISDGSYVNSTSVDECSCCYSFAVCNDTVFVGYDAYYWFLYPTSQMDGGYHSYSRYFYHGYINGTAMGMTWDGTSYYMAGYSSNLRVYNHDWTSYTDHTVGSGLPSVISPMAVAAPALAHDVGAIAIRAPAGTQLVGNTITPSAKIQNFGTNTEGPFDVVMKFQSYTSTKTITSLAKGDTANVLFDQVTLSTGGFFTAKCSTKLTTDQDNTNNAKIGAYQVANFLEGFETGNGNFTADPVGKWAWGVPASPWPAAHSGTKVWGDRLSGYYDVNENSKLYSPQYKALIDTPVIAFYQTYYMESYWDGMNFSYSTDGGSTWTLLYPWTTPAYYGYVYGLADNGYSGYILPNWQQAMFKIPVRNGTAFSVRWRFGSDPSITYYGVLVDDVAGIGARTPVDVSAIRLVAPLGTVDSGASVTPQCWLRNNTSSPLTFPARFWVGSAYQADTTVTLAAQESALTSWPTYIQLERGHLTVKCSTRMDGDEITKNDKVMDTLHARVRDVGIVGMIAPPETVVKNAPWVPKATYKNFGTTQESFYCFFDRDSGAYNKSKPVTLPAGRDTTMVFLKDSAAAIGQHVAKAYTVLSGDMAPYNDMVRKIFLACGHDVGTRAVITPVGSVLVNTQVACTCKVANPGGFNETFYAKFTIWNALKDAQVYADSALVTLNAGDSAVVGMPHTWLVPNNVGAYYDCKVYTTLATDQDHSNDLVTTRIQALVPANRDAGVDKITAPKGSYDTLTAITPTVTIKNYGAVDLVSVWVGLALDNAVVDTGTIPTLAVGASVVPTFTAWPKIKALGNHVFKCSTYVLGDIRHANDVLSDTFVVRAVVYHGWTAQMPVPNGSKGKQVKDGGALTYNAETGGDYIYGFKGNNTVEFYRFAPGTNTWTTQESIPPVGQGSGKKKMVKKGAALTSLAGKVYAVKGNATNDFFQFDPNAGGGGLLRWQSLTAVPGSPIKEGAGLAGVPASGMGTDTMGHIYLLKGSSSFDFVRYDLASATWKTMASAPVGLSGKPYKNGSCIAPHILADGTVDVIYALKASYNEFYKYDIAHDTWYENLPIMPMIGNGGKKKKVKDGAGLAALGDVIYGLKGDNTNELWHFQRGMWVQDADMPSNGKTVKGGGALTAWGKDLLYALKGNSTLEFYLYGPSSFAAPAGSRSTAGENAMDQRATAKFNLSVLPNPIVSNARICYSLPRAGNVSMKLYDVTGTLVSVLADGYCEVGSHTIAVDAGKLARGIYVLKFASDTYRTTTKLILE